MKRPLPVIAFLPLMLLPFTARPHDPFKADTTRFVLTVGSLSTKAMDAFPQRIASLSKEGNGYRIALTAVNPYADSARRARMEGAPYAKDRTYDRETARYLQSTPLIDAGNPRVKEIADTLFGGETTVWAVINKALSFTNRFISPDSSLARQIDAGVCRTLDVGSVIERRKGTCSEYANLFIALMRCRNIPARLAVGYIYSPQYKAFGSHAWAECYIEGVGWSAVDPTMNACWFPHFMAIKMRHGIDYEECGIGLLKDDIEPTEIRTE